MAEETEGRAPFHPEVRVRLVGREPFFGPGTAGLLRGILVCGCISGACERMKLSYSKGRTLLRQAERELGCCLVRRTKGGPGGGSALLTEAGARLLLQYEQYEKNLLRCAQETFGALRAALEAPV